VETFDYEGCFHSLFEAITLPVEKVGLAARKRFLDFVRRHGDVHAGALLLEEHEDA
jgi:hypothetical protein